MSQSARIAQRVKFYLLDSASNVATNAVQTHTFSGTPTGGTFTVSYNGGGAARVSSPITLTLTTGALSATTATAIQTALNGMANVGANGFTIAPLASPAVGFTATAGGNLAGMPLPLIVVDPTLVTPTGTTDAGVMTTPGVYAGPNRTTIAQMAVAPWPAPKLGEKEFSNFDSNYFKEWVPELFDNGNVKIDANYIGDPTQDYKTGLLQKFYSRQVFTCIINLPDELVGPGVIDLGLSQQFSGFFTEGAITAANPTDVPKITASLRVTGQITNGAPLQLP